MAKRPNEEAPKQAAPASSGETSSRGLKRRDFVKLVGGTGVVVSAGVLAGEKLVSGVMAPPTVEAAVAAGSVVGPGEVPITLRINGKPQKLSVEPRVTLLDALRDRLHLTGAKKVCDRGTCGACTVVVNGKAIYSCSILAIELAERAGAPAAEILTIEGIAAGDALHPVSAAFVDHDAQQCGFCTPGFVMACKAYLDSHHNPTEREVEKALGGNLCRCGTYMGVRQAVVDAAHRGAGRKG